ncbi:response regulator [Glaciecola sp. 1036]|uniref:response regulator n=1 Tax=Alteromonadaceae TaxID=72275 RepID=UPI003D0216F0
MHQILIIDDDLSLTELLNEYLTQQGYAVTVANQPRQGIELIQEREFDVLLLDVMMPDLDGFTVLGEVRKFSKIPILMLTAKGDDYDKILGLELGADDYLAKPFNHRELLARIKALVRRLSADGVLSNREVLKLHSMEINLGTQQVSVNHQNIEMTGTEFYLLVQLVKNTGRLLTKEHLSEVVLNRKLAPFDRSLDMHISNLRKKLSEQGINDVIKTIRGNGYLMTSE